MRVYNCGYVPEFVAVFRFAVVPFAITPIVNHANFNVLC